MRGGMVHERLCSCKNDDASETLQVLWLSSTFFRWKKMSFVQVFPGNFSNIWQRLRCLHVLGAPLCLTSAVQVLIPLNSSVIQKPQQVYPYVPPAYHCFATSYIYKVQTELLRDVTRLPGCQITLRSGMPLSRGNKPSPLWTHDTLCVSLHYLLCRSPKGHRLEMRLCSAAQTHKTQQHFTSQGKKDSFIWNGKEGKCKSRGMKRVTKHFSCYNCCCFSALCAGFVSCLQPAHTDKVERRNGSQ